jgi:hypothetical protein
LSGCETRIKIYDNEEISFIRRTDGSRYALYGTASEVFR